MHRFPLALAFAMFLGQASPPPAREAPEQDCAEACPGDGPDGRCSLACRACPCCAWSRTLAPVATAMPLSPRSSEITRSGADEAPPSPEPGDIFHVPRSLRA